MSIWAIYDKMEGDETCEVGLQAVYHQMIKERRDEDCTDQRK